MGLVPFMDYRKYNYFLHSFLQYCVPFLLLVKITSSAHHGILLYDPFPEQKTKLRNCTKKGNFYILYFSLYVFTKEEG
jgi:hypothetical protein